MLTIALALILSVIVIGTGMAIMVTERRAQEALAARVGETNLEFMLDDYEDTKISGSAIIMMITRGIHVYTYPPAGPEPNIAPVSLNATHLDDLEGTTAVTRDNAAAAGILKREWYPVFVREHTNGVQALVVIITP
jgi:hypothetical protein